MKRTSTFLQELIGASDLENFFEFNADEMVTPSFHGYITELCESTGQIPEHIIRNASIERSYGHQLFKGTRNPSRDKVIQIAFGFQLDPDETQQLLKIARKTPLYPRYKRDAAILFCLTHKKDVFETQSVLHSLGLTLLGDE
jgi:hypothetical protein